MHFVLQKEGEDEQLCRGRHSGPWWERRSVSCEIDLEPGRYEVLPKIVAERNKEAKMVEDVVREW